jgi:hypothetical protein
LSGLPSLDNQRRGFSDVERIEVWIKGREVPGRDLAFWRYDDFDNIIFRPHYGDADSACGWEIDHITPLALGGTNSPSNLRPRHCPAHSGPGAAIASAPRGGVE